LLEAGYTRGDKFVLFSDETSSAEQLVAQMGAIKAGVAVVTFTDKENADALDHALTSTKAKGLIFAPDSPMGKNETRGTAVNKLMPELSKMYLGDELNVSRYPNLTQIIQTGFKAIRGVNLFKDLTVYASP
jgi:long-subunit acyl-CoA synthetase (AMP-forming)